MSSWQFEDGLSQTKYLKKYPVKQHPCFLLIKPQLLKLNKLVVMHIHYDFH